MRIKCCKKCLRVLPTSEFYGAASNADRITGKCKVCYRACSKERYYANKSDRGAS